SSSSEDSFTKALLMASEPAAGASGAGDRHRLDQDRAAALGATTNFIGADGDDAGEHLAQVAGDGDLLDRIRDDPVLHPVATRTARIVAGDVVDPLSHQVGDEQS